MKANAVPASRIRVFLVDDHPALRRGIADCLAEQSDMEVCGEAGSEAEALSSLARKKPDVVIADISLPGRDGLEMIKAIKALDRRVRVLVFSMHDESLYAERALRAGARGYVMKTVPMDELTGAIRRVWGGEYVVGRPVVSQLAARAAAGVRRPPARSPFDMLTDREMEVFRLLGHGLERRVIATRLHLSPKTVEAHRSNIRVKLGLNNSAILRQHAVEFLREEAAGLHRA